MKAYNKKLVGLRILICVQSLIVVVLFVLIVRNLNTSVGQRVTGGATSFLESMLMVDTSGENDNGGSPSHVVRKVTEEAAYEMTNVQNQKELARRQAEEKAAAEKKEKEEAEKKRAEARAKEEAEKKEAEARAKEEAEKKEAEARAKEEAEKKEAADKAAAEKKAKEEAEEREREAKRKEEEAKKDYILAESNTRYYSVEELQKLDDETLQMAINELYARHGRKFDTESIRKYFEQKSWYKGTIAPKDFDGREDYFFNDFEKENRKRMVQIRDQREEKKKKSSKTP